MTINKLIVEEKHPNKVLDVFKVDNKEIIRESIYFVLLRLLLT